MAVLQLLNPSRLVSRKICMAGIFWNFHTVYLNLRIRSWMKYHNFLHCSDVYPSMQIFSQSNFLALESYFTWSSLGNWASILSSIFAMISFGGNSNSNSTPSGPMKEVKKLLNKYWRLLNGSYLVSRLDRVIFIMHLSIRVEKERLSLNTRNTFLWPNFSLG